jgi:hypothetical protein
VPRAISRSLWQPERNVGKEEPQHDIDDLHGVAVDGNQQRTTEFRALLSERQERVTTSHAESVRLRPLPLIAPSGAGASNAAQYVL